MSRAVVISSIFIIGLLVFILGVNMLNASGSNISSTNSLLKLSISTSKEKSMVYKVKEPVSVIVKISNISNSALLINGRCIVGVELLFNIENPSGKKTALKKWIYSSPAGEEHILELSSGKDYIIRCNIDDYYIMDEIGKYAITAIYHPYTDSKLKLKAWSGKIKSNTIELEILESY